MGAAVTVVDLGLGNLGSVLQALGRAGGEAQLSSDPRAIAAAPRLILPGVAAFGMGMDRALALSLKPALEDALARGTPLLGICLGMQILFDEGNEDGTRAGLGMLPGRVTKLPDTVSVPHIGWQQLVVTRASPLLAPRSPLSAPSAPLAAPSAATGGWAYFANSYRCEAPDAITFAIAEHLPRAGGEPVRIAAVVQQGQVFGVQHHPEKSAADGQALLARFLALPAGAA
jgi:glutamine amidotransferase